MGIPDGLGQAIMALVGNDERQVRLFDVLLYLKRRDRLQSQGQSGK